MVKKIRRSGDARVKTSKQGIKPSGVNTNKVTQVPKHDKNPLSGKVLGSNLDDDGIDVIILK